MIFFYKNWYVEFIHKNHLDEEILVSIHKIHFHDKIRTFL